LLTGAEVAVQDIPAGGHSVRGRLRTQMPFSRIRHATRLPPAFTPCEFKPYPGASVAPLLPVGYRADKPKKLCVRVPAPVAVAVPVPFVVCRAACPKKGGHLFDAVLSAAFADETVRRHGISAWAKMAAVFFRISFAERRALFSFRSGFDPAGQGKAFWPSDGQGA